MGKPDGQDARVGDGRVGVVDRAGASGEYQADGVMGAGSRPCEAVQGRTTEKTFCSRMRRAMSWVYCAAEIEDDNRGGIHVLVFQGFPE